MASKGQVVDDRPTDQRRALTTRLAIPEAKAPWEVDGRKWHTRDRVAGNGRPARWDGRILETIVDRIEAMGPGDGFAPTEWSQRGVVRINGQGQDQGRVPLLPRDHLVGVGGHPAVLRPEEYLPRASALEKQLELVPFHQSRAAGALRPAAAAGSTTSARSRRSRSSATPPTDFETPGFDAFLKKAVAAFLGIGKPARFKRASELTG